jgi:hypothetical protein
MTDAEAYAQTITVRVMCARFSQVLDPPAWAAMLAFSRGLDFPEEQLVVRVETIGQSPLFFSLQVYRHPLYSSPISTRWKKDLGSETKD